MKRSAALLMIALFAVLMHFGAMTGFAASVRLSDGRMAPMHHVHGAPASPVCPIGFMCPIIQDLPTGLSGSVTLAVFALIALLCVRFPNVSFERRLAFSEAFPPPNDPKTLLSVFKRE